MRIIRSSISGVVAVALSVVPLAASAERAEPRTETWPERTLTVETIVKKHVAALGGEKLLRAGKSFSFTVSGEKLGKAFTKTVSQARPNKLRIDVQSADGPMS